MIKSNWHGLLWGGFMVFGEANGLYRWRLENKNRRSTRVYPIENSPNTKAEEEAGGATIANP
jgi:hypothetical protein